MGQTWQGMQKDKQPQGEKVIKKWNARAQTFAHCCSKEEIFCGHHK